MIKSKSGVKTVVIPYAVLGSLYIILSDYLVKHITSEIHDLFLFGVIKGILFIIFTSILIYFLVRRHTSGLRKLNKNYLGVFMSLPEPVIIVDNGNGKIEAVNLAAQLITKYTPDELNGMEIETLLMKGEKTLNFHEVLIDSAQKRKVTNCRLINKNKDVVPINLSVSKIGDIAENTKSALILRDLTELEKNRSQLSEQKGRLEEIMNGVDSILWCYFADENTFQYINQSAERIYGIPLHKLYADLNLMLDKIIEEDREVVHKTLTQLKLGKERSRKVQYRIHSKSQKHKWLETKLWADSVKEGSKIRLRGITTEITHLKEYEHNNEKYIKRLKRFAFLTAHEVRRPLTNILGIINLIHEEDPDFIENSSYMQSIDYAARELDDVIKHLAAQIEEAEKERKGLSRNNND